MEAFCSPWYECCIDNEALSLMHACATSKIVASSKISTSHEIRVQNGNIKARTRMIILYDAAAANNGIVLSTDNLTEFMMGFWTLHGDVGDYGMIQQLWKSEVYNLASYLTQVSDEKSGIQGQMAIQSTIDAKPTDGNGISDSDLDQLLPAWKWGYREGYQEIDKVIKSYICACNMKNSLDFNHLSDLKEHPVVQRYLNTEYKRNNPYNISREDLFK